MFEASCLSKIAIQDCVIYYFEEERIRTRNDVSTAEMILILKHHNSI